MDAEELADLLAGGKSRGRYEVRCCTQGGGKCWVELQVHADRNEDGRLVGTYGTIVDITDRKRDETLSRREQAILEALVGGAFQRDLLDRLYHLCEELIEDSRGPVLVLDENGRHLRFAAGPGLPADYNAAVESFPIGPRAGGCGTAAFTGQPILVGDIASNPLCREHGHLATDHGLLACWSYPLTAAGNDVQGAPPSSIGRSRAALTPGRRRRPCGWPGLPPSCSGGPGPRRHCWRANSGMPWSYRQPAWGCGKWTSRADRERRGTGDERADPAASGKGPCR